MGLGRCERETVPLSRGEEPSLCSTTAESSKEAVPAARLLNTCLVVSAVTCIVGESRKRMANNSVHPDRLACDSQYSRGGWGSGGIGPWWAERCFANPVHPLCSVARRVGAVCFLPFPLFLKHCKTLL